MARLNYNKNRENEVKQAKMYKGLYNEISRIAHIRFIKNLDKKYSPILVQKKMLKHPSWINLKNDLEIAEFLEEKKAEFSQLNIFTFIIVAFLAVVFFGGLIYAQGLIYNVMHQAGLQNEINAGNAGYTNMTLAADITFGTLNDSIQSLRLVALMLILGLAVCMMITNALVKINPIFFFIYIILSGLAIFFSVPVSNAYYTLYTSDIYGGLLQSFTGSNWILLNLPTFVLIIGVIGGILLFINLIRGNEGGLQ